MKNLLYFGAGLIIGAAAGLFAGKFYFKNKYEEIADNEIKEMEDYYRASDEYSRKSKDVEEDIREEEEPEVEERSKRKKKEKIYTDYTSYYDKAEHGEEIEEAIRRNEELKEIRKSGKPPKIISQTAIGDLPEEYDEECLLFYALDQTLTDEDENIIDDPDILIGDSLTKYNFVDSDEERIYVVNYVLEKVYEIVKVYENFTLEHMISEHERREEDE